MASIDDDGFTGPFPHYDGVAQVGIQGPLKVGFICSRIMQNVRQG